MRNKNKGHQRTHYIYYTFWLGKANSHLNTSNWSAVHDKYNLFTWNVYWNILYNTCGCILTLLESLNHCWIGWNANQINRCHWGEGLWNTWRHRADYLFSEVVFVSNWFWFWKPDFTCICWCFKPCVVIFHIDHFGKVVHAKRFVIRSWVGPLIFICCQIYKWSVYWYFVVYK